MLHGRTSEIFRFALLLSFCLIEAVQSEDAATVLRPPSNAGSPPAEQARPVEITSVKHPALREELLRRAREDQEIRLAPNADPQEMMRIDAYNTMYIKAVIDKYGWPGKSMVGSDGTLAVFLLVQHAAGEGAPVSLHFPFLKPAAPGVAFQKRCLELLIKAVEQKEAPPDHMAYLTDRILVMEDKPQRYGTQFSDTRFLGASGELKLQPIEDEANVDARRKEVGLPPLAEYVRQVKEMDQR